MIFYAILVTLDYKTLTLLSVKKDNLEFQFGGRGINVEFCFICNAIRVSANVIVCNVKHKSTENVVFE